MALSVSLQLQDNETLRRLRSSDKLFHEAGRKMLERGSLLVLTKAKEKAPRAKSTLAGSITSAIRGSGSDMEAVVGTNVHYAAHQEFGTGVYGKRGAPIRPKRGKFLRWKGKDGRWVFAKEVKGVRPKRYFQQAIEHLESRVGEILNLGANYVKSQLGG